MVLAGSGVSIGYILHITIYAVSRGIYNNKMIIFFFIINHATMGIRRIIVAVMFHQTFSEKKVVVSVVGDSCL